LKDAVVEEFLKQMHPVQPKEALISHMSKVGLREDCALIDIHGLKMSFSEVEALLYLTGACTGLLRLTLVSAKIDSAGLELLNKQLEDGRSWPVLEELDLSFNSLAVPGLRSLVRAMERGCPALVRLKLSGCNIYANGAALLAAYLKEQDRPHQQLKVLDLSFNAVQSSGAELLADALRSPLCLLEELNLRHNQIGVAGAEFVLEALEFNQRLRRVCLADNKIGPDLATLLAGRLKRASTGDVSASVLAKELNMPAIYSERKVVLREFGKGKDGTKGGGGVK
jgi:Ran GTPase-activating protein (RanGAP) involved in mRNA processing and transport